MSSLREQIIGSWELIDYHAHKPDDESDKVYPMGRNVQGIIMYTPDGYMSAQLLTPGQKPFNDSREGGTQEDWATVGHNFVAYTGHFYLDERGDDQGRPILMHHMKLSNMPYLVGDTQRRLVTISEEGAGGRRFLNLGVEGTVMVQGEMRVVKVKWRRMADNQATSPPAK